MRKHLYDYILEMDTVTESTATMEQKAHIEMWNNPIHLAQEMNRGLYDLNWATQDIKDLLNKIRISLIFGLGMALITWVWVALK